MKSAWFLPCKRPERNWTALEGEAILDFSSVRRIDPSALQAMEEFVRIADDKAVKVVLRGVNVDVYKVLKLVKLDAAIFLRELRVRSWSDN